jgi:hypothetical protein
MHPTPKLATTPKQRTSGK